MHRTDNSATTRCVTGAAVLFSSSQLAFDKVLRGRSITEERLAQVCTLDAIAHQRGQSLAQTATIWALRDPRVTSATVDVRSVAQLEENPDALTHLDSSEEELAETDSRLSDVDPPWAGNT